MKGQTELVVVIGILIVAVVVVLFVNQQINIKPIEPGVTGPQQEQKDVENYVVTVIDDGSQKILKRLKMHGGFLNPRGELGDGLVAEFLFQDVPVWQACDMPGFYQDISGVETEFEEALANYLMKPENIMNQIINGRNVVFDTGNNLGIDVNIFDNKIDITVNMPTTIDNVPMQSPFTTSIQTNFGRIYKFAKDFSEQSKKSPIDGGSFFEVFLESSIRANRDVQDQGSLTLCYNPLLGCINDNPDTDITEPANCIDYSSEEIETAIYRSVFGAIQIELWRNMTDQSVGNAGNSVKMKAIPNVNGNVYSDLYIRFDLPDDFFNKYIKGRYSPIMVTNPALTGITPYCPPFCTGSSPIPGPADICGPVIYNNVFDVAPFPVIIGVRDINGDYFNFATMVDLDVGTASGGLDPADILQLILGGSPIEFNNLVDELDIRGDLQDSLGVRLLGYGNGSSLIQEDSGFIKNSDLPEGFGLELLEESDNVCYYDATGDGEYTNDDVFWVDSEGNCGTGFDDISDEMIISSSPASDSPGVKLITEGTNIKYNDKDGIQNGMYDSGEEIYFDLRDGLAELFNNQAGSFSGQRQDTLTAIANSMSGSIDMFPGDCLPT